MATMDDLAFKALAAIKGGVPTETKLKHLAELKAEIKHRHCPEPAVAPLFEVIRISISTPLLTTAGFSILGHLMKRLQGQGQESLLQIQGVKTYPCLLERLADQREPVRHRAIQALSDFHAVSAQDVEQFVRDKVLTCRSPKAKESGIQWVTATRKEKNIPFRTFVPNIVDCLEDADGNTRTAAQAATIELFQNASLRGMNDLQKHLQQRNVRKTIVEHILSQLGVGASPEVEAPTPARTNNTEPSKQAQSFGGSTSSDPLPDAPPMSVSEQEAMQLDPVYIESSRDLEETFREMHPWFEGRESEGNWLKREKNILKLRKITKGNAPKDFITLYLSCIKGLLDGILKTVNSLRTTVSTIGCHLIQDIARVAGSGMDSMVEILLQNLIKLCANTKKITAAKANETVSAIMANVSYHIRLTQHIHAACQDKNAQPRNAACGWLKTIITKHCHHKSVIEHAGGLDLIEKCLKLGLADRDKGVRDGMRPTYWAFARRWPERSEVLMSSLDNVQQKLLIEDPANPNPQKAGAATAGGKPAFSKSTNAISTRPSIKETIAAQKKAKAAGWNLPERPSSAEPFTSPKKSTVQPVVGRPGTAIAPAARNVSNTSIGTLSSAPVRPRRRADVARPATADPYSNRKLTRIETPPRSPAVSPVKRVKTPAPPASNAKLVARKVDSPASSKANSPKKNGPLQGTGHSDNKHAVVEPEPSPTRAAENFTMVIPNLQSSKSNDLNSLPEPVSARDPFLSGALHQVPESANSKRTHGPNGMGSPNHRGGGFPRLTPTKLTGGFGDLSLNDDKSQRVSMSPRAIGSRKEALTPKISSTQDPRPLQVYEDPVRSPHVGSPYPPPLTHTTALEELPVNERTKQRGVFDHQLLAEEPQSPGYHQKWLAMEARERQRASISENLDNPLLARKILNSGIDRVKARTLDVHGLRKLQTLIRSSRDSIWEDGYKFDELVLPLLEYLEIPNDESAPRSGKAQDLKTQVLVTVRLLLQHQPKYFSEYHPRAITAVLATRKQYSSTSHIVCGLEETAESIVHQCDPGKCIDSVLDLLETERSEGAEIMGLYILAGLLHRGQGKSSTLQLSSEQEERLGRMGARCLSDTNPDIRRAVIEFVLELHDAVDQDRFWSLVAAGRDDHRSLITYYLARKKAIVQ